MLDIPIDILLANCGNTLQFVLQDTPIFSELLKKSKNGYSLS